MGRAPTRGQKDNRRAATKFSRGLLLVAGRAAGMFSDVWRIAARIAGWMIAVERTAARIAGWKIAVGMIAVGTAVRTAVGIVAVGMAETLRAPSIGTSADRMLLGAIIALTFLVREFALVAEGAARRR